MISRLRPPTISFRLMESKHLSNFFFGSLLLFPAFSGVGAAVVAKDGDKSAPAPMRVCSGVFRVTSEFPSSGDKQILQQPQ